MREVICIHIGQGGVQMGETFWDLLSHEHHIRPDRTLSESGMWYGELSFKSFFKGTTETSTFTPRSLFVDLEPSSIDKIKVGTYRNFYEPYQLLSAKEDAASNFARGRYNVGKNIIDTTMDRIRKLVDDCSSLKGFLVFNTVGGGTGSGLGSLVLERLSDEYEKKSKTVVGVFPSSKLSYYPTEAYNAIFASHYLLERQASTYVFENEALHQICQTQLDLEKPTYQDLNGLIAPIMSSVTTGWRYPGYDITEHWIPYYRLRFNVCSYCPFWPADKTYCFPHTIEELTTLVFKAENYAVTCNPKYSKHMAVGMVYRGDCSPKPVNEAIAKLKASNQVRMINWTPVSMINTAYGPDVGIRLGGMLAKIWRTVCAVSNSTGLIENFQRYVDNFNRMFAKRAYVHWYTKEGLEEFEFNQAKEDVESLIDDYGEAEADIDVDEQDEVKQAN